MRPDMKYPEYEIADVKFRKNSPNTWLNSFYELLNINCPDFGNIEVSLNDEDELLEYRDLSPTDLAFLSIDEWLAYPHIEKLILWRSIQ